MKEEAEATSAMGATGSAANSGVAGAPQQGSDDAEASRQDADEPARRQRMRAAAALRAELSGEASWRHVLAEPTGVRERAMGKRPMAMRDGQETRRPRFQQGRVSEASNSTSEPREVGMHRELRALHAAGLPTAACSAIARHVGRAVEIAGHDMKVATGRDDLTVTSTAQVHSGGGRGERGLGVEGGGAGAGSSVVDTTHDDTTMLRG